MSNRWPYAKLIEQIFSVSVYTEEVMVSCPFHEDAAPSLQFNVRKGMWVCFSCKRGGSFQTLVGDDVVLPPPSLEVVRKNIDRLLSNETDRTVYPEPWLDQFEGYEEGESYWLSRGFSGRTQGVWRMGYDPAWNRVTVALRTKDGDIMGVLRRSLGNDWPRYLYPKHFGNRDYVFGAHMYTGGTDTLILTEGSLDAIKVWQSGYDAGAMLGSKVMDKHITIKKHIQPDLVIVFMDDDTAGYVATSELLDKLSGMNVRVANYEAANALRVKGRASDPGEMDKKMIQTAIEEAMPTFRWRLRR